MIRKAQTTTIQYSAQQHWLNFLIRHSSLLKVAAWLGSFSLSVGTHVVSAEFNPPVATPDSTGKALPSAVDQAKDQPGSADRLLHHDLFAANNLQLSAGGSSPAHHYQLQAIKPLALQSPVAVDCQQRTPRLVSSLCSQIRPQQHKTISSINTQVHQSVVPTKILPAVQPLPVVKRNSVLQAKTSQSNMSLRFARSASLTPGGIQPAPLPNRLSSESQLISKALPLPIKPLSKLPTVSKPQVAAVAPIPTVKVAAIAPTFRANSAPTVMSGVDSDFVYPLASPAPVTSRFGWRVHPISGSRRFHAGMDFGAPEGAPIVAAARGRVVIANWHGGYGKAVVIEHNNGKLQTLYGHMSEILVEEGQEIPQGTVIGRVGSTGRSTGAHLHFETQAATSDGWVAVDPQLDVQYALSDLQQSLQMSRQANAFAKPL